MYPLVCLIYLNIGQTSFSSSNIGKDGHKHIAQSYREVDTETQGGDTNEYSGEDPGLDKQIDIGEDIIADIGADTGDDIGTDIGTDTGDDIGTD